MIYSEMVKKASLIAYTAHKYDFDQSGYPYVMHPLYLAFQMDNEDSVCVALLHDVVEDHLDKYSFEYLERQGFSAKIINSLRLLTHDKNIPYMDYIEKIKSDETAKKVKIADLRHNLDMSRRNFGAFYKDSLYNQALRYLTEDI